MKPHTIALALLLVCGFPAPAGAQAAEGGAAITSSQPSADPALAAFIAKIRAVDNHTHVNTIAPDDSEYDALPLESLMPFPLPVRLGPENPDWLAASRALYGYPHADLNEPHVVELRGTKARIAKEQGARFPEWVLDRVGTEVMLANRVAMGPGLAAPHFRWVSYVDALMLPLSTKAKAATSPDRVKLYPLEEKLLRRYLADLDVAKLPPTLDRYLRTVVTPTLERQRKGGCVAVKFEAGYLRPLDFGDASVETASRVYSKYVGGGEPPRADYKALEDFLFRYIAREAGRLGMAVHIHSLEGAGSYYQAAGSDPLLLESAFNDPTLRGTNFVIVHGGGVFAPHAGAMLWKPNVYLDTSALILIYPPAKLAQVFEDWLSQFPEKVLFGSDASAFGPDIGWDTAAWVGTTAARRALGIALTDMMRNGDVSRARAEEIATMVLRTNAGKLYKLGLQ
jgi:predicted TIM-barrel fold metal-dependent hydrolase